MWYLVFFLYIVPAIHFYWEAAEEPELVQGFQWIVPVFLWPILLPIYMVTTMLFGGINDD